MAVPVEFLVSTGGQMPVSAAVRHRWGLDQGGKVIVVDLGDPVILLPRGGREKLRGEVLTAEAHRQFAHDPDDPDLATG
jgi:hypothetical protein